MFNQFLKFFGLGALIIITSILFSANAQAATDIWEKVNPPTLSGSISAVGTAGNYVYLGTSQGVYMSTTSGQSWQLINNGLSGATSTVSAIAIGWVFNSASTTYDVSTSTNIYLGTAKGVYTSKLGSSTWSLLANTAGLNVVDIKIDQYKGGAADPSTIYIATSTIGGLYRSDDSGASWTLQNTGMETGVAKKIVTDWWGGNIFAITNANEIYKSVMNSLSATGESWSLASTSVANLNSISMNNASYAPDLNSISYLSTDNGIYRSIDSGANWIDINNGINDLRIKSVASDYFNAVAIAAGQNGAYLSVSGTFDTLGDTWGNANLGMGVTALQDVVANPVNSSFWAISTTSIYRLQFSNIATATIGLLATSDIIAPSPVNDLSTSNNGTSSISLSWLATGNDLNSGTAAAYDIRYSTSTINDANWNVATQVNGEPVPGISGTNESMIVSGLLPATQYYFAMKVVDGFGNWSLLSNVVGALTLAPDIINPTTPGVVVIGTTSATVINISWASSTDNVAVVGYKVFRATTTGTMTQIGTTTNIYYSVTGSTPLTSYSFVVAAYDAAGNTSAMTATTSTSTLPSTPTGFTATAVSTTGINLAWSTTTEAVNYYAIYNGASLIATTSNLIGNYSVTSLTPSTLYNFNLKAVTNSGLYSASTTSSATTQAVVVTPVVSSPGGSGGGGGSFTAAACTSWTYSVWTSCMAGKQSRTVMTSLPSGCSGGTPVLTQSCNAVSTTTVVVPVVAPEPVVVPVNVKTTTVKILDTDKDGLSDDLEVALGTNPFKMDTDGDGVNDKQELLQILNPIVAKKEANIDELYAKKNQGKVFLQVENKGQAWYINPKDLKRYYLGRPANAFEVMRKQGMGVKHSLITKTKVYPDRLLGRILIDVEDKGRAYYINPKDEKAYSLGKPADAFAVMRKLGIGITNKSLDKISVGL
ncbi:MAG: fibronectin type III domain-containing protein [bacterium]